MSDRPAVDGLALGLELGEGSGGVVFAASETDLGRDVAVKVLSAARPAQGEGRFLSEARITARIDHPGVVPVHRLARTATGQPAYVMKRIHGTTLREWIARRGFDVDAGTRDDRADVARRLEVFLKLADTVHFAHTRGVVHRDLKPENVMIGEHGEVWVMDWGIASAPDLPSPTGAMEGTPGYLAPEQADGAAAAPAQDQYALGLVLQELVTLREAVSGRSALERALANSMGHRVPPTARRGGPVSRELAAIVARSTQFEPEARYADVAELAADVRRHLAGEAVRTSPDSGAQAAARWVGRHRELALAGLIGIAALGALSVGASEVRRAREGEAARREEAWLAERVASVAGRAARIDARLQRDEGLLGEVAAVAAERLVRGGPTGVAWLVDEPGTTPVDLAVHPSWGQPVSLSTAAVVAAPGADRTAAPVLAGLAPTLRRAASRADDGAGAWPIPWLSIALNGGLSATWPGHADFAPGYDARLRPWFRVAESAQAPVWGAPYADSSGLGLLLPCSAPIVDPVDGHSLGVASAKLSVDRLIGDLLAWDDAHSWLLDGSGRVLADSTDTGRDLGRRDLAAGAIAPTFPDPRVVEAARTQRSAAFLDDGSATVVHPVWTLDGAYVVRGGRR